MLKTLLASLLCLLTCGCSLLFYPVTGFYVVYKLEVPRETQIGDFLQYSFTTYNPIRGWIASSIKERFTPSACLPENRFAIQAVDCDGDLVWEKESPYFKVTGLPYNRIGKTTLRVGINDQETLNDLKTGKRSLWMAIIRLDIPQLSFPLSTEVGEETLTPTIIPATPIALPDANEK